MLRCLDANLSNRPTTSQLYEYLGSWISAIRDSSDLSIQFDAAELVKFANSTNSDNLSRHEQAVYFSRSLGGIKRSLLNRRPYRNF